MTEQDITSVEAQSIRDFLTSHSGEMLEFLEEIVSTESPSLVPETQKKVFDQLAAPLRKMGYVTQTLAGKVSGGMLYARPLKRVRDRGAQLLLGHSDTVWASGTLERMPVRIQDGKMTGPGIYDMKAGLTQMIFALKALHEVGIEPALTPVVFVNSDEELRSEDSEKYIRLLARRVRRVFVLEPGTGPEGYLKTSRKGVGEYLIEVTGRAAHAGVEPDKGVSAILEISRVVEKLASLNDPERGVSVNVGVIEGGTRTNVVAAQARAVVDVRVPTARDAQAIDEAIKSLKPSLDGATLRVSGGIDRMPLEQTPRNQKLWRLARETGRLLGLELQESSSGGGSDGNLTSVYTATLDGVGAVGGGAHALHEFISISHLVERSALLALLLAMPDEEPA